MERLPVWATAERFVWLVTAGGLAFVAGLWLTTLFAMGSVHWLAGAVLVASGIAGLAAGIWDEVAL